MGLCETSPYIAWAYLTLSPIIALSSLFGAITAKSQVMATHASSFHQNRPKLDLKLLLVRQSLAFLHYLSTVFRLTRTYFYAGFYGAFRVKGDVEAEKGKSDGEFTNGEKGDDDGLQTTGQVRFTIEEWWPSIEMTMVSY